jgi:peptidoglycan/LPS O-acetylase OafA/YrhL
MSAVGQDSGRNIGLDALRAAAILLVLVAHFLGAGFGRQLGGTPVILNLLGHLGVELFFVLSGFLIGNLLLDVVARGPTLRAWGVFMCRRVMRTMPAYFVWLAVLLATKSLGAAAPYVYQYATFTQNLAWPMPPGNWFGVSWSLTVEEWFYLLFSITALSLAFLLPRAGFWLALVAFLTIPLALRIAWPPGSWDEVTRKIVFLRLDAIAYGVLLASLMRNGVWPERTWRLALLAGLSILAAIGFVWLFRTGQWEPTDPAWRVLVLSATSIGLVLLIPASLHLRIRAGPLRNAVEGTSRLSYGLYLTHIGMLDLTRRFYGDAAILNVIGLVLAGLGAVLLSQLSWRYVEKPILDRRPKQSVQSA